MKNNQKLLDLNSAMGSTDVKSTSPLNSNSKLDP